MGTGSEAIEWELGARLVGTGSEASENWEQGWWELGARLVGTKRHRPKS